MADARPVRMLMRAHRGDLLLAGSAAALLAALLSVVAVAGTADPTRREVLIALYGAASLLEATGVVTIGLELLATRRRGRAFGIWTRTIAVRPGPPPDPVEELTDRVRMLEWRIGNLVDAEGLNIRGWCGFAALLLGLLIGTAANIVSAV